MGFHHIPIGEDYPEIVNVIVEIPKGGNNKYEYDEKLDLIKLDRVLYSPVFYPVDYGFVPQTREEDGDHMDIMVITNSPTFPGCLLRVTPIGVLRMSDDQGRDSKVLAVPLNTPYFYEVNSLDDLPRHTLKEIVHFFEQYKSLEEKKVVIDRWGSREDAMEMIRKSHAKFKEEG